MTPPRGASPAFVVAFVFVWTIFLVPSDALSASQSAAEGRVLVNPLSLALSVQTGRHVAGRPIAVTGEVENGGSEPLVDIVVTLRADPTLGTVGGGDETEVITVLGGGEASELSWRVCARSAGTYVLMLVGHATMVTGIEVVAESPAIVLSIAAAPGSGPGRPRGCP